jgi:hypothetical protein
MGQAVLEQRSLVSELLAVSAFDHACSSVLVTKKKVLLDCRRIGFPSSHERSTRDKDRMKPGVDPIKLFTGVIYDFS